jgi:transaldolase
MMRAGRGDYQTVTQEICSLVQGPISAEVVSEDASGMVEEARRIAQWSPHVLIKVPIIEEGLKAIHAISALEVDPDTLCNGCPWFGKCDTPIEKARELASLWGVRTNCTLVFSANQALLAALAGATFVSSFVGRLDDAGHDGMQVVADIVNIFDTYDLDTRVLAASIRHPLHITQAALAGADVATVPFDVLQKAIHHPLTDIGVRRFLEDWAKVRA